MTQCANVRATCRLDTRALILRKRTCVQGIAVHALEHCNRWDMDPVSAEISPHPLKGGGVRRAGKPTLCTAIEEERSGNSLRHGLTFCGPKDDSIEEHHLFIGESGECLPICIHDL